MKDLSLLVSVVTPNKLKELAVLADLNEKKSKINALYKKLVEGEYTEDKLRDELFEKGLHQNSNFNRVKRQLKERLIDSLFLIDANQPKYPEITQAYYLCYKYSAAVKILLGKRARSAAISIAERTFKIAEKYEFTDILLHLSKDLRIHYGNIIGDKRKFSFYNQKVKYYGEILSAELKAEEYYSELALTFSISRAAKAEHEEMAKKYSEDLEGIIDQYSSYRFRLYAYSVLVISNEMTDDYKDAIDICDRALVYFDEKKHLSTSVAKFTFYFRKISNQILLGELKDAEATVETCLKLEAAGLPNWYKAQGYLFIVYNHLNEHQKAFKVYKDTVSHKDFDKQYPNVKETWYIYEAYIYYFYLRKAIQGPLNERLKKFRLNKFLNEVPTYSKDKRGMNIAILILQVLFLLHQEKYGQIIDRVEALRTYTHRYLRRDETFRSNCFIKMLMQLPKANFHKAAVIRKTADLRKKLSSVGIRHNQSAEVEAVPYEVLWEFVLGSLKNKIH